jgi:hypothetical protein
MAHVGETRAAVVLHDEKSPNNRMRAWLRESDATDEEILRAAREPELRWWEDPVGNVWEVRVEESLFPAGLEQRSRPRTRIVFQDAGRQLGTELPEGRALGELTGAELTALLYESS